MQSHELAAIYRKEPGPLYVLLHGLQGNKELFTQFIAHPAMTGKAVFAPDFPGFGGSRDFPVREYSISCLTEIISDALKVIHPAEVIVIGHSLGGMVGIRLASRHDCNVRAVISLEGNLTLADCGASLEISRSTASDFRSQMLPKIISNLSNSSEPSAQFRANALAATRPEAVYEAACSIVDESRSESLLGELQGLTCRALLLVGEKSSFATRELDSNVQIDTIPGAGHFLLQDNFERTFRSIDDFLSTDA